MNNTEIDSKLLQEAEWAAEHIPDDAVPQLSSDELEKIWERLKKERENKKR